MKTVKKMRMYGVMDEDGRISQPWSNIAELFYRKIDAKDCCDTLAGMEVVAFDVTPVYTETQQRKARSGAKHA